MIVVRLSGGLGNQLFQYATGRALAIRHGDSLIVDHRIFQTDTFRQFSLPLFHAEYQLATDRRETEASLPPSRKQWMRFLRWRLTHGRSLKFVRERTLDFDPYILDVHTDVYLHGYWQCEKYFKDAEATLRRELRVRVPPSDVNSRWLSEIDGSMSVSLHVRRGDYVSDPKASRVHGVCSLEYYQNAVEYLSGKLSEPLTVYVFSDDPAWVREHLKLPCAVHYMTHNDDAHNYEDLRLMTACRHHIIANSSFSWWGAWLGRNAERQVIAPALWFHDPSRSDRSLIPSSWVRL